MKTVLHKIIHYLSKNPFLLINLTRQMLFNFILPNFTFLISKRVVFQNFPVCDQKIILTGTGNIEIGESCSFGYRRGGFHEYGLIELQARYKDAVIKIGNNVSTNNNMFICAARYIEIGKDTCIGEHVCLMDFDAHGIPPAKRKQVGEIGNIIVGQNVWIGNNVTILKNTKIGDNTIVAAGSVVVGEFPANVVIGGVPSKIIKTLK